MTDPNLAIMDGMPFDEWIAINGNAQRVYKTFRERYHSDVECMVVHDGSFFVRDNNDGFHEVSGADDFNDYEAWCARCGVYLANEENWCYCDYSSCDNRVCTGCLDGYCSDVYCPEHEGIARLREGKEPEYTHPYNHEGGFTFGVEIETEGELPGPLVEQIMDDDNSLVAGWGNDPSLSDGVELQTNVLNMEWLRNLEDFVSKIPEYGENAGGHIHVARTCNQCASRWYWALHGLEYEQCLKLNMRHKSDDYWCELNHGEYRGKHVAVNDEHDNTIELRTFDCWCAETVDKLAPAVRWIRDMWRFFERHPRGTLKSADIERHAALMANNETTPHTVTVRERLTQRKIERARKAEMAAHKAESERKARRKEIATRVQINVETSRRVRASHGNTSIAEREYVRHLEHREYVRNRIRERLESPDGRSALPSRNLKPLHMFVAYAEHCAKMGCRPELDRYGVRHAVTGEPIWGGYVYMLAHRGVDVMRVIDNILLSRKARRSHGTPQPERLERTALRLLNRMGRPELNPRYVQIKKMLDN